MPPDAEAQSPHPLTPSSFLTRQEAALLLRISPARLGCPAWRRRFGMPVVRVGGRLRFERATLLAWIVRHREAPEDAA